MSLPKDKNKIEEYLKRLSDSHKGKITWNKGLKNWMSLESKQRMIDSKKGKPSKRKNYKHSEETKKKLSESHKGYIMPEEQRNKISESNKGGNSGSFSKERFKEKENHPRWLGGISFEPYGLEFNEDFKEVIRNRDRRKCCMCEKTELEEGKKLQCHHIDYNKKNNDPINLISLCTSCHMKTNSRREYWIKFFNFLWQ